MLNNIKNCTKKSEKIACLFGSFFKNYLPLHPISELKALSINEFLSLQGLRR